MRKETGEGRREEGDGRQEYTVHSAQCAVRRKKIQKVTSFFTSEKKFFLFPVSYA
jgi:hypothetical protein